MKKRGSRWKWTFVKDGKLYIESYKLISQTIVEISSLKEEIKIQENLIMDTSESQKQLELSIFGTRDLVRNCVYKVNELSPLKSTCTASTIYAMRSLRDWIKILDNELKL